MKYVYIILLMLCLSCHSKKQPSRSILNLEGSWQFDIDTANVGESQGWFLRDLSDQIQLPGTTDTNKKGFKNTDTTTAHLNRLYTYEGQAWYQKKIVIPEYFKNKNIQLVLERTKTSKIWIDSTLVGGSSILQSAQTFNVSDNLSPGKHHITIQINNDLKLTPYGNVHIYSNDTQTNWNGILGDIYLEASSKTYISNLQVHPDVSNKKMAIELEIENQLNLDDLDIEIQVEKTVNGKTTTLKSKTVKTKYKPKLQLDYHFEEAPELWSAFHQPLYKLTVQLNHAKDSKSTTFGMRDFKVKGTQFTINGKTTFLRGKHEAAVFPLTGYPPMDVEGWVKIYNTAKSYGINHYRFHTYCPPKAAFEAADLVGIYLQAELPFWGGLESDSVAENLKAEGLAMLKAYANHPSFVLFSPGNEIWSGHDKVENIMTWLKEKDSRPLYTIGSNNNIGYMEPLDYADFFVGARIPKDGNTTKGHTRLTHAHADAENGGLLNTTVPNTEVTYDYAVSNMKLPIISHEIGQYQIYPNYNEIDKYTGVLRAWNLETFKNRLQKSGMQDLDSVFQKSSGAWSALCYKAEMEAALRTKGFAGFQLLDLQDFPGQGTALVGILDAFMDSKNVISTETWKQSCDDVVILLEFPKYCYKNDETFKAELKVANYSPKDIYDQLDWQITNSDGSIIKTGNLSDLTIAQGDVTPLGEIQVDLKSVTSPSALHINVTLNKNKYSNSYPIWVYPTKNKVILPKGVHIAHTFTSKQIEQLENGDKVLLFPKNEAITKHRIAGLFPPEFWNYGMFKKISENANKAVSPGTLGLLMRPEHPLFDHFPTDFHTNWQWYSIIKSSRSLILDQTTKDYRPIVQVIDNLERNHKLGLIFEFKVGRGKLLVCMPPLHELLDHPEAAQLYQSVLHYMSSKAFNPSHTMSPTELMSILN